MNHSALLLAIAQIASAAGMAWLALAMPAHWEQVRSADPLSRAAATVLRVCGVLGLLVSLALCLSADHGSMASLVWVMSIAAAAVLVAMVLSWRPTWLRPLVAWLPSRAIR